MEDTIKCSHICTVCKNIGYPKKITPGSFIVELLLWIIIPVIFFLTGIGFGLGIISCITGLAYSIWRLSSKKIVCPKCESPFMIPVGTPEGQRLLSEQGLHIVTKK